MAWTVVGQDTAVNVLRSAIANGRIAHAYLFAGPARVGKTCTARQFAQALNCDAPGPPCGECRSCLRIESGKHPDVEFVGIGAACDESGHDHSRDNSRDIRICQIRRVEQIVTRAPFEGRHRVVIIEPADSLNTASVSALLKTLEEPPPYVVFVLVTDQDEQLPDTIRSRARRVPFAGQPRALIEQTLRTRWEVEPEAAAAIARVAGGRLGLAVAAATNPRLLPQREEILDQCEQVAQGTLVERFAVAGAIGSRYARNRQATQARLELWQEWWRDLLLVAAGRDQQVTHVERLDTLRALAAQCDVARAVRACKAIADARQQLSENASPTLTLEGMMLALPRLQPNAVASRLRE